ncbi:MAG: hypothetical protein DU429_05985 [Candidatus Tokpelaia sp.]|nr:MAG: hypothetical protein DU429_05985 [Candidatus Tokpelaia sp.]KAA6206546.1 MAG: hypothetical protein DU430_00145 [Candidatus Tokpelaia sp.]
MAIFCYAHFFQPLPVLSQSAGNVRGKNNSASVLFSSLPVFAAFSRLLYGWIYDKFSLDCSFNLSLLRNTPQNIGTGFGRQIFLRIPPRGD